jgi:hypothetical protein
MDTKIFWTLPKRSNRVSFVRTRTTILRTSKPYLSHCEVGLYAFFIYMTKADVVKTLVFRVVIPCSVVDVCPRFGVIYFT